ncbi:Vitamin B12 dependent methionine synthase, activation domain protein [Teladorsagia circumcincta]|uniref:Vitamin B12 dependent methionine synthase, activation domain protein n=1 Tax=Teladorsagia circumcincta TaxID=45464 RepID=A0A2G9UBQ8_TELCI|nr:Vitamin B12 dependent methionine synthase, activation domain protein [Teladorsagia circumcincta]
MEEHSNYGVYFIDAARMIRENLPGCHVSGGVSNISFSFRGMEVIKSARVMKKAVAHLIPFMDREREENIKKLGLSADESPYQGTIVLATVKGDVHDIGKNIVAVVLGCNNFKVVDLGVMTPCEAIIKAAVEEQADFIGCSGLITPSLDEMVHVAKEMQRVGLKIPLLIGTGLDSRPHSNTREEKKELEEMVVKKIRYNRIAKYRDCSSLTDKTTRDAFIADLSEEYEEVRQEHYESLKERRFTTLAVARTKRMVVDFEKFPPVKPFFLGRRKIVDFDLRELLPFIDWKPFFDVWQLRGKYPNRAYPRIFNDDQVGEEAKRVYSDAQNWLGRLISEKRLKANAVVGFFEAGSDGDDIQVFDEGRRVATLYGLRQQSGREHDQSHMCISDFIKPLEDGQPSDYLGLFACSAGIGAEEYCKELEKNHDDYASIMVKALADRLAEAFAEYLHRQVRIELWGYSKDESKLGHGKIPVGKWYEATDCELQLTEHLAMLPAASVSGLYFASPASSYFAVGKIDRDQVSDYATRKGMSVSETERWLSPILGYEVDD